jgi:hypothetical protein
MLTFFDPEETAPTRAAGRGRPVGSKNRPKPPDKPAIESKTISDVVEALPTEQPTATETPTEPTTPEAV